MKSKSENNIFIMVSKSLRGQWVKRYIYVLVDWYITLDGKAGYSVQVARRTSVLIGALLNTLFRETGMESCSIIRDRIY